MTPAEQRALTWMRDFGSHKAAWQVDGRTVRRENPDTWNGMRLTGADGSILIHVDVWRSLKPYIGCGPLKGADGVERIYYVNEDGLTALQRATAHTTDLTDSTKREG